MANDVFYQVGKNIQEVLSEKNKTQQYLADCLQISRQVMNKIVMGAKAINVFEISKIASVLEVPVDQLLNVKEEEEEAHNLSFMGHVKNIETRKGIKLLETIIEEIIMLEDYANGEY